MNEKLLELYRRCRNDKPFMQVGHDAECSLRSAYVLLAWREVEAKAMRALPGYEAADWGAPEKSSTTSVSLLSLMKGR